LHWINKAGKLKACQGDSFLQQGRGKSRDCWQPFPFPLTQIFMNELSNFYEWTRGKNCLDIVGNPFFFLWLKFSWMNGVIFMMNDIKNLSRDSLATLSF
jgi:hypothetical protein